MDTNDILAGILVRFLKDKEVYVGGGGPNNRLTLDGWIQLTPEEFTIINNIMGDDW